MLSSDEYALIFECNWVSTNNRYVSSMQEHLSSPDTSRIILRIDPKQSSNVQHLPRYTLCNSVIVFPIKSKVQVSSHWREELATSFPSCQRNFECYEWQIWSCISSLFLNKRTETLSFCTCSFVSWLPQHIWCLHRTLRAQIGIVGDVLIVVVIFIPRIEFEFRTEGRMLVAVFAIVDQTIAEEWGRCWEVEPRFGCWSGREYSLGAEVKTSSLCTRTLIECIRWLCPVDAPSRDGQSVSFHERNVVHRDCRHICAVAKKAVYSGRDWSKSCGSNRWFLVRLVTWWLVPIVVRFIHRRQCMVRLWAHLRKWTMWTLKIFDIRVSIDDMSFDPEGD